MKKNKSNTNHFSLIGMLFSLFGPILFLVGIFIGNVNTSNTVRFLLALWLVSSCVGITLSIIGLLKRKKDNTNEGFATSLVGIILGGFSVLVTLVLLVALPSHYSSDDRNSDTYYDYDYSEESDDYDDYDDSDYSGSTNTTTPEQTKEEFIQQCQSYTFDQIARRPNDYIGQKAVFTGKVIQVQEIDKYNIVMRVDITKEVFEYSDYVSWSDTIYVIYKYYSGESKVLEDDIITMYGTLEGEISYTSVLGSKITLPKFSAKYITISQ